MAGRPAAVVINTGEIIALNAGNTKKENLNKYSFTEYLFFKKINHLQPTLFLRYDHYDH